MSESRELQWYIGDVETSGLSVTKHELNQLSIIRCTDRSIMNKHIYLEDPAAVDKRALEATNRTIADLLKGDRKEIVVDIVDNWLKKDGVTDEFRCLVGYNVSFDRRFLQALWKKCGLTFPITLYLDLMPLAKEYAKLNNVNTPNFKLGLVLKFMDINQVTGQLHEAAVDSKNTYLLFEKLKKSGISHTPYIKRFAATEEEED